MKIEQNSATFGAIFVVTFVFLTQNKFVIEDISGLIIVIFFKCTDCMILFLDLASALLMRLSRDKTHKK